MVDDIVDVWTELMNAFLMAHQIWFFLMLLCVGIVTGCFIIYFVRR